MKRLLSFVISVLPVLALAQTPADALWSASFAPAALSETSLLPAGDPAGLGVLGPLALSRTDGTALSAGYAWLPSGMTATGVAFSTGIGSAWRLGAGVQAPSAEGVTAGSAGRTFNVTRRAADLGGTWSFSERLWLGASLHWAWEKATPDDASGDLARDWATGSAALGLALPHGLSAALSATHWGGDQTTETSDDPRSQSPPRAVGCDVAWASGPFGVQVGGERSRGEYSGRVGGLLAVGDRLLLRAGVTSSTDEGERAVFSGGADMLLGETLVLAYAYGRGDGGGSHTIGCRWQRRHYDAQVYHSDRHFVEQALRRAIASALADLRFDAPAVAVAPDEGTDEQVRRVIAGGLLAGGTPVYESLGEGRAAIMYNVVQKELVVSEDGSWLTGGCRTHRRFRATVVLRYLSPEGRVTGVARAIADVSDTVPAQVSNRLENREFIGRTQAPSRHDVPEMLAGTAVLAGLLLLAF